MRTTIQLIPLLFNTTTTISGIYLPTSPNNIESFNNYYYFVD